MHRQQAECSGNGADGSSCGRHERYRIGWRQKCGRTEQIRQRKIQPGGAWRLSTRRQKKSDNPDVLYGRDFDEEAIPIEEIIGEMGEVVIRGKIIAMDQREIRNERTILIFDVTDFTDTMTIKILP